MNPFIVDITPENAQQSLIDESMNRPVVVDFWSDRSAVSKTLSPTLEKLANEHAGQFLLARLNCDEQQGIAAQFGIRNLPTVMIIKDGQPVDGFSGEQSEPVIRELLGKHLPKPWDSLLEKAREKLAEDLPGEALPLLLEANEGSGQRADIAMTLAQAYLELNRCSEAEVLLNNIALADQDSYFEQLQAQLTLKQQAAKTPEIEALEAKLNQNPDDLDSAYQLALQLSQQNLHRESMELLYSILQQDRNFQDGAAKKMLLDVIKSLGNKDPLATEFQRKLFSLLY
jgi:putative thioredoxin